MSRSSRAAALIGASAGVLLLAGCRRDMQDQPKYKPLAESQFFADHRSARPQVEGTIARGHLRLDQARYTGKVNNADIDYFPIPITRDDVERGRQRFDVYCSPCHSRLGDGMGMVVRRGYRQPPSYYSPKLVAAPVGHFFDVMTNGFGGMPSYASRVAPDDRWRIAAYIRALQLSMSGKASQVPPDQMSDLQQHPEAVPLGPFNNPPANPAQMQGSVPENGMRSPGNKAGGVNEPLPGAGSPRRPPAGQPKGLMQKQ
jgi:mono/diheme cytochrome c family protein